MGAEARLQDLFAAFGAIRIKRMFGGQGLFAGDLMIGYTDGDIIYLKTDETTRPAFAAEGCAPLTYRKHTGAEIALSFWSIPDRLYDEPDELAEWARRAYAAAEHAPSTARKREGKARRR